MADARTVRFDPHVHTEASHDCSTPVETVLEAASDCGLDAVAVTDHDAIDASLRAVDRASTRDLVVVPGVEVSTADGHLLALGVTERPDPGESLSATVDAVRAAGGVAVVPHPFQSSRHGVSRRALVDCDAVEVHNAWAVTGVQNARARSFARRRDYPAVGASDAHSADVVGRAYTDVTLPDGVSADAWTADDLLAALRAGRTSPAGDTVSASQYLGKYVRSFGGRTATLAPGLGLRSRF